ncbi:MBL fold metallo-hydrolase [Pontibacter sp. E15-1]|uniref:MBL fold metallo-hydrolase n=1 Tax=Pontibacter sp. E15-1 TaxID=2919918 RepID=UPI001F4FAF0D|nr:MBL fold metallo-hydrolase [Pontibacter sp. E15-1]MCJ8163546.1 MBL fold metallo-hydrolase [Pontibacter sp. E15-1]
MKLKSILTVLFAAAVMQVSAQNAAPDQIKTNKGDLTIQPIQHATLVLTWEGKTIYVDPTGGAEAFEGMAKPDLILITDIHGDHMDVKTLDALQAETAAMIVPQAVANELPMQHKSHTKILGNGESTTALGIPITAVPMYNLPESADAMHTKGRGNGYVLRFGNKNVYISGDTEGVPEVRNLKNIDVAFLSMNLPYTMDVEQAASTTLDFKPKVIYPYHYRGQNGLSNVAAFKKMVNDKYKNIEVRLRDWYPAK